MKQFLLFIFALTFSFLNAQYSWTNPVQVDPADGRYPSIHYLSTGEALLFYNIVEGASLRLKVKKVSAAGSIGSELTISSEGRVVDILEWGNDSIYMCYETSDKLRIYLSKNRGGSWSLAKSYTASEAAYLTEAYDRAYFTRDGNSLRVFFKYEFNTGVFGTQTYTKHVKMINGVWNDTLYGFSAGHIGIVGAYEFGDTVSVFFSSTGNSFSTDNTASFADINGDGSINGGLYPSDVDYYNDRIHLLHAYTFGSAPNDKYLVYSHSDDKGKNWLEPQKQIINGDKYCYQAKILANDERVYAFWVSQDDSLKNKYILYSYSENEGDSWVSPDTAVALDAMLTIDNEFGFEISNRKDTIGLIYGVLNDLATHHVYFKELINDESTSIQEEVKNDFFSIYPNPVSSVLRVKSEKTIDEIHVYDSFGRLMLNTQSTNIDVSTYSQGIYYIKVIANKSIEARVFIVD